MNQKGFTLVELLAVVIIISLLVIIALPLITNSVKNFSGKTDKLMISMIEEATKLYIDDNKNDFPKNAGNSYCITLNELVDGEYLKKSIELNGKDVTDIKSVQVTYDNGYKLEIVDSDSCIGYRDICKPVTEETKTTGNIPQGNLIAGDEYICEVKPGTEYRFFVLSKENNKVNLIMNRNICEDGTVATEENTCLVAWYLGYANNTYGPVTAMKYLHNATKHWNNIPKMIMNYEDENIHVDTEFEGTKGTNGYGGIKTIKNTTVITDKRGKETGKIVNLKTRLPRYDELTGVGKCTTTEGSCPLWLVNYMTSCEEVKGDGLENISKIEGYWTLSSVNHTDILEYAWDIDYNGDIDTGSVQNSAPHGVRPVISLPQNYLLN